MPGSVDDVDAMILPPSGGGGSSDGNARSCSCSIQSITVFALVDFTNLCSCAQSNKEFDSVVVCFARINVAIIPMLRVNFSSAMLWGSMAHSSLRLLKQKLA